ncbi:MAG: bifunctional folylpolyglutamate synthase/dihydrofolate synthase [Sphaerochaetaceae bacterium]|nr:bifunctional folylpolyglutamate synthase/dihydrofolate synthase [Sphaerochaetaceae bacterium]
MSLKTFDQVISFMEEYLNLERKTNKYSSKTYCLDKIASLMEHLGNPQNSYKTIHVAGSKGKGSTATFIAKGLQALGYKVGLYMSPHVSDYRERFTLCGTFFPDEILISTGNKLKEALKTFVYKDNSPDNLPTTFELYTAFAFLLFKEANCQWAVIETGLGGRLDATNILLPEASVITTIDLEHTEILGNTLALIAGEKSKIIKKNRPSFFSPQKEEALNVLISEAISQNSIYHPMDREIVSLTSENTLSGQKIKVILSDGYCKTLNLKLQGYVQGQNCALALFLLRDLNLYKEGVTEKALENTTIPGRMEKILWERNLYLDGAHTVNSMNNLLDTFCQLYPSKNERGVCIFGSVAGKSHEEMAKAILKTFDKIVVCRPGTFKKSDPKALYELLISLSNKNHVIELQEEAKDALLWAKENTEEKEPVLCCGSFYLAGSILEALK